jgi:hypothetical protein
MASDKIRADTRLSLRIRNCCSLNMAAVVRFDNPTCFPMVSNQGTAISFAELVLAIISFILFSRLHTTVNPVIDITLQPTHRPATVAR